MNTPPFERAVDLVFYAPIGLGLTVVENGPVMLEGFIARGRAEIDRRYEDATRHVTTARSHGEVALAFGLPKLRGRVQRRLEDILDRGNGPAPASTPEPAPPAAPAPEPVASPPFEPYVATIRGVPAAPTNGAATASLPIPGYDELSASQVVERLLGLGRDELEAVREYEATHRNRRTILGKIEQLAS